MLDWIGRSRTRQKMFASFTHIIWPPIGVYYGIWVLWNGVLMPYWWAYNETDFYSFVLWSVFFTLQIAVLPIALAGLCIASAVFSFNIGEQLWEVIVDEEAEEERRYSQEKKGDIAPFLRGRNKTPD